MLEDVSYRISELFDNRALDKYPLKEHRNVGKRGVRRLDGHEKAGGQALYTIDVALPGMLCAKFLTSPHPHARIVRMDILLPPKYIFPVGFTGGWRWFLNTFNMRFR